MVSMSKKTLCVALVALAAGSAVAEGPAYPSWWNSASVSGSGHSDAEAVGEAISGSGTASVATSFANNIVQGTNSISASGSLAEGWYGEAETSGMTATTGSTSNYNGNTYSAASADSDAAFEDGDVTSSNANAAFNAYANGDDLVGSMGAQATVATAEDSYDEWWGGYHGVGGAIGGARSKARQGLEDWWGPEMLFDLDAGLDAMTMGAFDEAALAIVDAGYELNNLGK